MASYEFLNPLPQKVAQYLEAHFPKLYDMLGEQGCIVPNPYSIGLLNMFSGLHELLDSALLEPDNRQGIAVLSLTEEHCNGHFTTTEINPGHWLTEAVQQLGALLALSDVVSTAKRQMLLKSVSAEFKQVCLPGQLLFAIVACQPGDKADEWSFTGTIVDTSGREVLCMSYAGCCVSEQRFNRKVEQAREAIG